MATFFFLVWLCRHTALVADKIGDLIKLEILVQNESFGSIVGARTITAPRIGGIDNDAGKMSIRGPSCPHILQIHSPHQIATVTLSHVPLWRRGIIIAIFCSFGTSCMVPLDWDLALKRVCDPNFITY